MHTIGEINVVRFGELERLATFTRLFEVAHYISRRVSEEWLLEAVLEPAFHLQGAQDEKDVHRLCFEDGEVVEVNEALLTGMGCKFEVDFGTNDLATIEYPVLGDIPTERRILQKNPSILVGDNTEDPKIYLPVREEHDLEYHEIIVQLHQARDESLDFVESLRTQ